MKHACYVTSEGTARPEKAPSGHHSRHVRSLKFERSTRHLDSPGETQCLFGFVSLPETLTTARRASKGALSLRCGVLAVTESSRTQRAASIRTFG